MNIFTEEINELIEQINILTEKMNELIIVKEVEVKAEVEVEVINSNNFDEESIKYNNSNESDNLDDDKTVKYNNSNESDEFDYSNNSNESTKCVEEPLTLIIEETIKYSNLNKSDESYESAKWDIIYATGKEKKFLLSAKKERLMAYDKLMDTGVFWKIEDYTKEKKDERKKILKEKKTFDIFSDKYIKNFIILYKSNKTENNYNNFTSILQEKIYTDIKQNNYYTICKRDCTFLTVEEEMFMFREEKRLTTSIWKESWSYICYGISDNFVEYFIHLNEVMKSVKIDNNNNDSSIDSDTEWGSESNEITLNKSIKTDNDSNIFDIELN